MPIIPYDDFQGRLARRRQGGELIQYELGEDGVYRPITTTPTRPVSRPVRRGVEAANVVGLAVDAVCTLRSLAPNEFTRRLVSASPFDIVPGVRNAREGALRYLCDESPEPEPTLEVPFVGGQCDAVGYGVQVTLERESFSNFQCNVRTQVTQVLECWGPVGGVRWIPDSPGSNFGVVEVYCRGPFDQPIGDARWIGLTSSNSSAACRAPYVTNIQITRLDGLPDNCGNPVLQLDQNFEEAPDNLSIDLDVGDGNTVNLPINFSFDPQVGIQIDVGDISINFDGENIEYTEPTDPGAQEEIPRLPPQNTFTQDDRDVINQTFNTVNQGVEVDLQPVLDRIDSLEVFVDGRFDSVDAALACIEELVKQVPCPECSKQFGTQVVGNLLFTLGDAVKYVQVARPGSCFLLVEVESAIPPEVRKYTLPSNPDEVEAGIGSFALTYAVEGGGTQVPDASFHLLNKLSSLIYLPSAQVDGVRFTCKPGIILTVTDLGYVRMVPEITCNPPPGA